MSNSYRSEEGYGGLYQRKQTKSLARANGTINSENKDQLIMANFSKYPLFRQVDFPLKTSGSVYVSIGGSIQVSVEAKAGLKSSLSCLKK